MVAGGDLRALKLGWLGRCLLVGALALPAGADLWSALDQGQADEVLYHLRGEFSQLGLELPAELGLQQHSFDQPLSFYRHETQTIRLSSLLTEAAQGPRYWQAWSDVFSGGKWTPGPELGEAQEMQRAANFTLLGILAHEMGHCADRYYGILEDRWNRPDEPPPALRELVADELAVTVLRRLAEQPRGRELLNQYRQVVLEKLRNSAPPERQIRIPPEVSLWAFAEKVQVAPEDIDRYCGYQLSRQHRLMERFEGPGHEQLRGLAARRLEQFESQAPWLPGQRRVRAVPASEGPIASQVWPWEATSDEYELLRKGGTERVRLEPLSRFVAERGWSAPKKVGRVFHHFQYLWDLHSQEDGSTLGLVVNRHRLTGARATASPDLELLLVEWSGRQPLKVLAEWTLPEHPHFTAALKVSPGGRRCLWVAREELTGYEPQGSNWKPCQTLPLGGKPGWLRTCLMDDRARLIWADDSRISRFEGSRPVRLAGSFWRGTAQGDARGQVCFQPELLHLENVPGRGLRVFFRNGAGDLRALEGLRD